MTRPDIEATLHATYIAILAEAVAVLLLLGIAVAWMGIAV